MNRLAVSNKEYFINPGVRAPRDAGQAFYYLVYRAGILDDNLSAANLSTRFDKASSLFEKYYINGDFPAEYR